MDTTLSSSDYEPKLSKTSEQRRFKRRLALMERRSSEYNINIARSGSQKEIPSNGSQLKTPEICYQSSKLSSQMQFSKKQPINTDKENCSTHLV